MAWDYKREESKRAGAGDYRFEVVAVEEKTSGKGNKMIVVSTQLNGTEIVVKDYFVEGEWFNRKMTQFFDATNIDEGDFVLAGWIGAVGAARYKEDENGYLKVAFYFDQNRAAKLPPWQGVVPERQRVASIGDAHDGMMETDEDLPF